MKTSFSTLCLAAVCAAAGIISIQAQEEKPASAEGRTGRLPLSDPSGTRVGERGGDRGGDRGSMRGAPSRDGGLMRMLPIIVALDTNSDGVIDAQEIANAPAALKKLDKNGDTKLTEDELRPTPRGTERGAGPNPEEMVRRLMEFDKNSDGKLAKDELPERVQAMMDRADADKDGFLSKDEIRKLAESQSRPADGGGRGGREGGREGGPRR